MGVSTIKDIPHEIMCIIVNNYLEIKDAHALSMTSHWGRMRAHQMKALLHRISVAKMKKLIAAQERGAWKHARPLIKLYNIPDQETIRLIEKWNVRLAIKEEKILIWLVNESNNVALQRAVVSFSLHGFRPPLSEIPGNIDKLTSLTRFIVHGYTISPVIPESIGKLTCMKEFRLCGAPHIFNVPESIGRLINLTTLSLCVDHIRSLPDCIVRLMSLRVLLLDGCENLMKLPDNIGDLTNLHTLGLSHTHIGYLPVSSTKLSSLHFLDMRCCKHLMELPDNIGDLTQLCSLRITCNSKITRLPNSITKLTSLQHLDLSHCDNLLDLPIKCFTNFSYICLTGSPCAALLES